MKIFSTLIWNGEADISLYLDCIKSQDFQCKNAGYEYFVVCNDLVKPKLEELGINAVDYSEFMPEEFIPKIQKLWSDKKFACASDILRVLVLNRREEGLHLDGDIYLNESPKKIVDSLGKNEFVIGVENGGWLCTGVLGHRGDYAGVIHRAANHIINQEVLEDWWQVYGNRLLSRVINETSECDKKYIKFLNPAVLLGIHYEVIKLRGSILLKDYFEANPQAIGLHMCGASLDFEESAPRGEKLFSTLYSKDYYAAEFKNSEVMLPFEQKKLKLYKYASPKFKYGKSVHL